MIDAAVIQNIPRFSGISAEAQAWLSEHGQLRTYAASEVVFHEGDPCQRFYMVVSGEVKVFKLLESGREVVLDMIRSGESFGEVALLDGGAFPANAEVRQAATVLTLAREDYLTLLQRYPEVAHSIIRDLTLRMHALRRRVEVMGEGSVQARIAQLLEIHMRDRGHPVEGGMLIELRLSRGELAGMVGARIETVIRIMSRWDKEDIVQTRADGFLVVRPDVLRELIVGDTRTH